ncbi:hypothetical protein, partial [Sinorhizobium sp. BJ1]|uniref:hypothetical protein n=1 Tax=Sinorhizobium sp. BJ1 TaxID=2035455 RepID=UPI001AECEA73
MALSWSRCKRSWIALPNRGVVTTIFREKLCAAIIRPSPKRWEWQLSPANAALRLSELDFCSPPFREADEGVLSTDTVEKVRFLGPLIFWRAVEANK